ncbi:MAG: lipopolysaccharide biosynthesis protein [Hyphomicrobium sp.]|nr:lipopolysaccharide biosynthesis protein [Hyphomicrobium sp.]
MLFRQTLLYLPAQVLGPLFQFISIVAWTHALSPIEMGVFALVVAVQEFAYTATTFWFSLYTQRYHDPGADAETRRRFLDTELGVLACASLATAAVVLLLPVVTSVVWTWPLALATVAYAVSRGLVTHLSDRARTEHDTLTYSVLQITWPVLGLISGWMLAQLVSPTADMVLAGYALAQFVSLGAPLLRLDFGRDPFAYSREAIATALRYGLPLLAGGLFVWVAGNGLRFVVEYRESAAAVGLITVGWGLGLRVAGFASMLVTAAAFPVAMRRARDEGMAAGQAQLERNGILLLAILAPACVGLFAISEPFVRLVVAQEFQAMTIAVLPLAIAAGAFRNFRIHFGEQVFLLHERPGIPLWNDAIDAVTSLVGGALGLLWGGLPGAVAGAALGSFISLVVTLASGWVAYRFAFPVPALLRIGLATLAMWLVVSSLHVLPGAFSVAIAVAIGAVVYGGVLMLIFPELARKIAGLLARNRSATESVT